MKNGQVIKTAAAMDTAEEMALVNRYTRRDLSADEVYLFSVALCDNDIDRDYERFTVEALFELEKLFVALGCIFVRNGTRAACKDDALGSHLFDLVDAQIIGVNLAIYIQFTDSSCNKLIILAAEIQDQYQFLVI